MIRRTILLLLVGWLIGGLGYSLQAKDKVQVVVIDAGHGGKHPGAVGRFTKEKDITLAVTLKLGKLIEQNFPDVKVFYTRTDDSFLEVWKRPYMANKHKADLFISIHCNSNEARGVYPKGFETYVLGVDYTNENLAVAQKENAAILYETDHESQYDGFDPNSPESYILFSLFQNAYLDQSLGFATRLQHQFQSANYSTNRGVKQAGFLVLLKAAMPSVLTEIGFINNPEEEKYMASEEGQAKISQALFSAFKEYKYQTEGFNNQGSNEAQPLVSLEKPASVEKDAAPKTAITEPPTPTKPLIVFKVQFASSSNNKSTDSPEFKGLENVGKYTHNGSYKYTAGELKTLQDATVLLKRMQNMGYKDAFVVVFKDQERITTSEALKLLQDS